MDRIAAINKSLSAFACGIIGCVPILGLGFAIYALVCWARIRRCYRDWNPAENYLKQGAVLGLFGTLLSVLIAYVIGYSLINGLFS